MHKMPGPKVRIMATKSVDIRAIVMVVVMGRPVVRHMSWMPMSSRFIQLISLKGISQVHLVIIFIGLRRIS